MINEALNRLEPMVYGFAREADALIDIVEVFTSGERSGVLKRAYIAKELTLSIQKEISDKKKWRFFYTKNILSMAHENFNMTIESW